MSAVRMCDRCGIIFSENAENWDSGSVGRKVTKADGTVHTVSRQFDQCGECSEGSSIERQAIQGGVKPGIMREVSERVRETQEDGGRHRNFTMIDDQQ